MSSQTVYFTNPAVITGIQNQVGTTPGQITTNQINLTGALINTNNNHFIDEYTIDKGLGPYQVDCIPIVLKDTFAAPKFSSNLSTTTGTHLGVTGGSNNISFTNQTYDTLVAPDVVVFAPSVRTTMETSPLFSSTGVGECMNLGAFGITLEDWRGNTVSNTLDQFTQVFGSATLGAKYNSFYNVICASGTTTTGARQAALDSIRSDPDFIQIKNQMKYPFKRFNQVKVAGEFQFENLLDLNGNPLVNTGAAGNTGYFTQITSTTYSATGNLLPIAQNVNAKGGKMGLMICHMGTNRSPFFSNAYHQLAGLGYVTIFTTHNPIAQTFQKYGNSKSYSTCLAEKSISTSSTASASSVSYQNGNLLYGSTTDNLVSGAGANGFFRNNARASSSTEPSAVITERFYYQMRCILQKLGIGQFIDYNNVIIFGESAGGYAMNAADRFITTGLSTSYKIGGTSVPLFKAIAFVSHQCIFYDYSKKLDTANSTNEYNNRLAYGLNVLKCPLITITGDYDLNDGTTDNRYNTQAQVIYQTTKLSTDGNADANLGLSIVFYKSALSHAGTQPFGRLNTIFGDGFLADWLQGWAMPLQPEFPSYESVYEGGVRSELGYVQLNELKVNNVIQMMGHRFLGIDFPFPQAAIPCLGMKYEIGPTTCDIATDFEYTRVGPIARFTYDNDYNVTLSSYNYQGATAPPAISFIATGSTGSFRNLFATSDMSAPTMNVTSNLKLNNSIMSSPTGFYTSNTIAGQAYIPLGQSTGTITNNLVTSNSIIIATVASDDSTLTNVKAIATSNTISLIGNAAATADTKVNWMVIN